MRKGIPVAITACAALAAAASLGVGSVISSFPVFGTNQLRASGVYRDRTYVYVVVSRFGNRDDYLYRYTVTGSLLGFKVLTGADSPSDADHCPLGDGYFAVHDVLQENSTRRILYFDTGTGSLAGSWSGYDNPGSVAYIPGSSYIYLGGAGSTVYGFTTGGSVVGSFGVPYGAGALAAAPFFKGLTGEYLITGPKEYANPARVYTSNGSLVGSFKVPAPNDSKNTYGAVCGVGYPAGYGTTYWCIRGPDSNPVMYQIDLGCNPAVTPASIGRVKALFR